VAVLVAVPDPLVLVLLSVAVADAVLASVTDPVAVAVAVVDAVAVPVAERVSGAVFNALSVPELETLASWAASGATAGTRSAVPDSATSAAASAASGWSARPQHGVSGMMKVKITQGLASRLFHIGLLYNEPAGEFWQRASLL
jgi:hypothetical protein